MSTFERSTIIPKEPGLLTFGGATFYSAEGFSVTPISEGQAISIDAFQDLGDERDIDRRIEITFTPVGEFEAIATLFPYTATETGTRIFGDSDSACVIYTRSGKSLTFHNAAVTSQPALNLALDQTLFGEVTITALIADDTDPTDSAAYYTLVESGATYPGDSAFSNSGIKTLGYQGAYGSTPWDEFFTEAGFTISSSLSLEPCKVDGFGTVDMHYVSQEMTASARPKAGVDIGDVMTALKFQGSENGLGQVKADSTDLNITNVTGGTEVYFRLYNAQVIETPLRFSSSDPLVDAVGFRGTKEISGGSLTPLFYLGASAPA